jgi:hypothetical protein
MGCEILFRKPKRIKDLVNLGVKKDPPINYSLIKNNIEGKNKKKRRENGSYRRKV